MRHLRGGGGESPSYGPCVVAGPYNTVRNGPADEISAGVGEVAVCTHPGDADSFAAWLVGTPQEVCDALRGGHRAYGQWSPEKRGRMDALASRIECHEMPDTPLARLASALHVRVDVLVWAMALARVSVVEMRCDCGAVKDSRGGA